MGADRQDRRPWTPEVLAAAARRVVGTSAPTDPFSVAVLTRAGAADRVALSARNDDALRELAGRDADAAVDRLTDIVRTCVDELGAEHPDTLIARGNLAVARLTAGQVSRAVDESAALLTDRGRVLGANHPGTVNAALALGLAHLAAGDPAAAATVLESARTVLELPRRGRSGRRRSDPVATTCAELIEIARAELDPHTDVQPAPGAPARDGAARPRFGLRPGTVRPDAPLSTGGQAWWAV